MHALAQYSDHRNRKVDSPEHVQKTQELEGRKSFEVYEGLMYGYLQTSSKRSAMYATRGSVLAEQAKLPGGLCDAWRMLELNACGRCGCDSAQFGLAHALQEKEAQLRDMERKNRMSRMQNRILFGLIMLLVIAVVVIILVARHHHRTTAIHSRLMGGADERTRLSRDLHDRLGGLLSAIHMQAKDKEVQALSLQAVDEMRRVAHHLMPAALKESGLVRALSDFCNVHPTVSFTHYGQDERLTEQQEVMLYCATHELVNNALKYAKASRVMVQLLMDGEYIALIVSDNGRSPLQLPQGGEPKTGSGLRNIRERAELLGGRMSISSSSEGTEINVEIPRCVHLQMGGLEPRTMALSVTRYLYTYD